MDDSNALKVLEKIYNAIKKYNLDKAQCWTADHVKFYQNHFTSYCTFDILTEYNQEIYGQCNITLVNTEETRLNCLTVSFKAYKESVYGTGNVYPKVTLPLNRYEVTDDVLGRYFYRLIHNLCALAVFYQENHEDS